MSKAILILDMPKKCTECAICQHQDEGWLYCTYYHRNAHAFDIPDWCPLKEAPEKELLWYEDERDDYYLGWNHCVDYILGEEEL